MGVFSFVKPGKQIFKFVKDKTGVITGVKPNLKKTVKETKTDEYRKRYTALDKAEGKIKSGKQMMKEGQKERKKLIDTKRAFQFKHTKSTHAIKPGEDPNVKYKGNVREQKMGGGMMGRRFGMKQGTPNPFKKKTNVDKINKTFAPKKNLSPKQMKIAKLAGNPNKIDAQDFAKLRGRS